VIFVAAAGWMVWSFYRGFKALIATKQVGLFIFQPASREDFYRPALRVLLVVLCAAAAAMTLTSWRQDLRHMYLPMVLWIILIALGAET
jgi:hypothetical protein